MSYANVGMRHPVWAPLSEHTDGVVIKDSQEVFRNAVKYLHIVIDPKIVFMIIALTFFLLDVAVRKFKWKWPHEIIRDKRKTKAMKAK